VRKCLNEKRSFSNATCSCLIPKKVYSKIFEKVFMPVFDLPVGKYKLSIIKSAATSAKVQFHFAVFLSSVFPPRGIVCDGSTTAICGNGADPHSQLRGNQVNFGKRQLIREHQRTQRDGFGRSQSEIPSLSSINAATWLTAPSCAPALFSVPRPARSLDGTHDVYGAPQVDRMIAMGLRRLRPGLRPGDPSRGNPASSTEMST